MSKEKLPQINRYLRKEKDELHFNIPNNFFNSSHIRPWDQTNLILKLIQKVNWFFVFLNVYVFGIEWDKILISQVFRRPEWTRGGNPWKWILTFIKYKYEYDKQSSKIRYKNGIISLVPLFSSRAMILKLPKIVHFCKSVLTSAENLNLLK